MSVIRDQYGESIAQIVHPHIDGPGFPLIRMAHDVRHRLMDAQFHVLGTTLRKAVLSRDTRDELSRWSERARTRFPCEAQRSSHRRLLQFLPLANAHETFFVCLAEK